MQKETQSKMNPEMERLFGEINKKPYQLYYTITPPSDLSKGASSAKKASPFIEACKDAILWLPRVFGFYQKSFKDIILLSFENSAELEAGLKKLPELLLKRDEVKIKIYLPGEALDGVILPGTPPPNSKWVSNAWVTTLKLLKNFSCDRIVKIEAPEDFFDNTEIKEHLEPLLQENRANRAIEKRQNRWVDVGLILGLFKLNPLRVFFALNSMFFSAVTNMLVAYGLSKAFEFYRKKSASYYPTQKEIDEIKDKEEKEAFIDGYKAGLAEDSKPYLMSFTKKRDWQHPVAFAAGMKMAEKQDEELTKGLKLK